MWWLYRHAKYQKTSNKLLFNSMFLPRILGALVLLLACAAAFAPRGLRAAPRAHRRLATTVNLELDVGGGVEQVVLRSETDAADEAARVAAVYGLSAEERAGLSAAFAARWNVAASAEAAAYQGPTPLGGQLKNVVARIDLEEAGLVLEAADSALPGAGRGLFVRKMAERPAVALDAGSVFCGYGGEGALTAEPQRAGGKSIGFQLRSLSQRVVFDGTVTTLRAALAALGPDASLAAHVLQRSAAAGEELLGVEPDPSQPPLYFVPEEQPEGGAFDITNCGQLCNDMAAQPRGEREVSDASSASYAESYAVASRAANALSIVPLLERDPTCPIVLRFKRPVFTVKVGVCFDNEAPMELGVEYGAQFWD